METALTSSMPAPAVNIFACLSPSVTPLSELSSV